MKKNKRKTESAKILEKVNEQPIIKKKEPAQVSFSRLSPSLKKNTIVQQEEHHIKIQQGPLPTPETLKYYNDINGKFAEIIVQMAVDEQKKSIEAQKNEFILSQKAINSVNLGRLIGFMSFLSLIGLAVYALYLKENWVAEFLIKAMITLVSLCSAGMGILKWATHKNEKKEKEIKIKNQ